MARALSGSTRSTSRTGCASRAVARRGIRWSATWLGWPVPRRQPGCGASSTSASAMPGATLQHGLLPREGGGRGRAHPAAAAEVYRQSLSSGRPFLRAGRHPDQQHGLDAPPAAGVRHSRQRPLPSPAGPRRRRRRPVRSAGVTDEHVETDAAGPETFTLDELVRLVKRSAVHSRALLVHHAGPGCPAGHDPSVGLAVRDVVLTRDEIRELMESLLASSAQPSSRRRASVTGSSRTAATVGRRYSSSSRGTSASHGSVWAVVIYAPGPDPPSSPRARTRHRPAPAADRLTVMTQTRAQAGCRCLGRDPGRTSRPNASIHSFWLRPTLCR